MSRIRKSIRRLFFLMMVFLLAAAAFPSQDIQAAPSQQEILYQEDFESGDAQGWNLEPGWQVIADGTNYVLAGEGHFWANPNRPFSGNQHISYRLKILTGAIHLAIRISATGRYFIRFDQQGTSLSKQYFPNDFQNNLVGKAEAHTLDRWYQVEFTLQENTLSMLVDDKLQWSWSDPQSLNEGSIAFETLDDSQAWVDDIEITGENSTAETSASTLEAGTPGNRVDAANLSWVRTGGPLGGLGYDVRMQPDNPDIMYVTDAKAGLFKSTDGGNSWVPKNKGITNRLGTAGDEIPVFCLTIDPNNYNTLWAGMQWASGFYKSTDGAETWKKMNNGVVERGLTTRGFGVEPGNSNVVYAAGEISSWEWAGEQRNGREFDMTQGAVYKTIDGGLTWKKVWQGDNLARYIWINPIDTQVVYVSTGIFDREAANSDVLHGIEGGVGVIKSTDGGQTWQQVNNGLGNLYVGTLFMNPANPDILLAGTGTAWDSPGAGVYRTTDGGQTWKQTLSVGANIESVEISTTDPQVVYAGGFSEVYQSSDGGQTWTLVAGGAGQEGWGSAGILAGHPIDFQLDPRDPDRLFSNQYGGGNFLSLDGGRTWESASQGYTGAAVRDIDVDPQNPGRVYAAARSGIFVSNNGGGEWIGLSFRPFYSLDWHAVTVDPFNPEHLLAGMTCWRNLVSSLDGGGSWSELKTFGMSTNIAFKNMVFSASDPATVYAGAAGFISCGHFTSDVPSSGYNQTIQKPGAGVFISHDGGQTWLQSPDPQMKSLSISSLSVDPSDPDILLAGTFYHGLFRSEDGGKTWNQVTGNLPVNKSITAVQHNPQDGNDIFTGVNQAGLYHSSDGGATWKQVVSGLPAEGVFNDVVFDKTLPQILYTTEVSSGIYRSADGGKSWQAINNGLSTRSFNALALSSDGLHLYAASESSGVYRLDLDGLPPEPAPQTIIENTSIPKPAETAYTGSINTSVPTKESSAGGKLSICGISAMLPLAAIGLVTWLRPRRRRK